MPAFDAEQIVRLKACSFGPGDNRNQAQQSTGIRLLDAAAITGLLACRFNPARGPEGTATGCWSDLECVWRLE